MTFAIITPALIAGAFADRMKFSAMLWFMGLWSVLIYSPIAHMMWEGTSGKWATAGILDFAGGTVVHINAGIAALVCALVLGKRVGYGKEAMPPHNLVLTVTGAALLWVGWFGFNAGSAVAADVELTTSAGAVQAAPAATLTTVIINGSTAYSAPQLFATYRDQLGRAYSRELTRAMDEIVWTINPKNDTLDHLANYIFQYAQEYFQNTGVRCRLDLPARLPDRDISTEERHNLFMAIKEALNNVLKHAGATEVRIGLAVADTRLTITIADNGRGFLTGTAQSDGNGLENMKQRLERIGGRLFLESKPNEGTKIRMEANGK